MRLEREQLFNDVKQVLVDELFVDIDSNEIKEEDQLGAGIGLDSVGIIELATIMEEKYGIKLDDQTELSENTWSVGSFINLITQKLSA